MVTNSMTAQHIFEVWLVHFNISHLSFAVNTACQHMRSPTIVDFFLVKRILRYIRGTLRLGLRFSKNSSLNLFAFANSNWAGCKDTQ